MAWWNKPEGTLTPSVSMDRLASWFITNSFAYELGGSGRVIRAGFDGVFYSFTVVSDRIMSVHGSYLTSLPTDFATVEEVRAVAHRVADSRVMPAVYLVVDEQGLGLHANATVSTGGGLNDEQLDSVIDFTIGGIDGAVCEILTELGQPTPDQAQGSRDQEEPAAQGGESEE